MRTLRARMITEIGSAGSAVRVRRLRKSGAWKSGISRRADSWKCGFLTAANAKSRPIAARRNGRVQRTLGGQVMRGKDYNAGLRGVLFEARHYRANGRGRVALSAGWCSGKRTSRVGSAGSWAARRSAIARSRKKRDSTFARSSAGCTRCGATAISRRKRRRRA